MNPAFSSEDVPGFVERPDEGPDYLALVIEWGDDAEAGTTVSAGAPDPRAMRKRRIATIVGALSAVALATWGLRRLRAAS